MEEAEGQFLPPFESPEHFVLYLLPHMADFFQRRLTGFLEACTEGKITLSPLRGENVCPIGI